MACPWWAHPIVHRRIGQEGGAAIWQVLGKLPPPGGQDPDHLVPQGAAVAMLQLQRDFGDDGTGALQGRTAIGIGQHVMVQSRDAPFRIDDGDRVHMGTNPLALAAAIHHDKPAKPSGNAYDMFEPRQSVMGQLACESGNPEPGPGRHPCILDNQVVEAGADLQHHAAEAAAVEQHVAAVAHREQRQGMVPRHADCMRDLRSIRRTDQKIRRAADAPARQRGQRHVSPAHYLARRQGLRRGCDPCAVRLHGLQRVTVVRHLEYSPGCCISSRSD